MKKKWNEKTISQLFETGFSELLFKAQRIHRKHFINSEIELCKILSVKTGACPEDCGYCSQSGQHKTNITREKLLSVEQVKYHASQAKQCGITRFCMGAAWRSPPAKDFPTILAMIKEVKAIGLETCVTLGMLTDEHVNQLKAAGLDYYNHNLDTSREHYKNIVSTHTYDDRLATLKRVHEANINVCCGAILGLGEQRIDRVRFLLELVNLPSHPQSLPINNLMPFTGTPLENTPPIDPLEFVRTIAVARIMMPKTMIRLSAGRIDMPQELQTLCFIAGANSMWLGEKLLTGENNKETDDLLFLQKLGMQAKRNSSEHLSW